MRKLAELLLRCENFSIMGKVCFGRWKNRLLCAGMLKDGRSSANAKPKFDIFGIADKRFLCLLGASCLYLNVLFKYLFPRPANRRGTYFALEKHLSEAFAVRHFRSAS